MHGAHEVGSSMSSDRQWTNTARQHAAPHAVRPGLLHAAQEAARDHGPGQAVAVAACIPSHSFSGITEGIASGVLPGFMGGCVVTVQFRKSIGTHHTAFGRYQHRFESHRMVIRAIPMCFVQRAWAQRDIGEGHGI